MEFDVEVECPHCGQECWLCADFDQGEFDKEGAPDRTKEAHCYDCEQNFWFVTSLRFDVNVEHVFEENPEKPKRRAKS